MRKKLFVGDALLVAQKWFGHCEQVLLLNNRTFKWFCLLRVYIKFVYL